MSIDQQAEKTTQTLIYPVYEQNVERILDLPRVRHLFDVSVLRPHMGAKDAITWFYGRLGQPDVVIVGMGDASLIHPVRIRKQPATREEQQPKRNVALCMFLFKRCGMPI